MTNETSKQSSTKSTAGASERIVNVGASSLDGVELLGCHAATAK